MLDELLDLDEFKLETSLNEEPIPNSGSLLKHCFSGVSELRSHTDRFFIASSNWVADLMVFMISDVDFRSFDPECDSSEDLMGGLSWDGDRLDGTKILKQFSDALFPFKRFGGLVHLPLLSHEKLMGEFEFNLTLVEYPGTGFSSSFGSFREKMHPSFSSRRIRFRF